LQGLVITRSTAEIFKRIQGIEGCIQRRNDIRLVTAPCPAVQVTRLFLLQTGGIQHDQARKFPAGRGGNDLPGKPPAHQQGNTPAVVKVGMRQEQVVNGRRVKSEFIGIVLFEFAAALVKPAVNKDALAAALKQVTGTGYSLGRTMK